MDFHLRRLLRKLKSTNKFAKIANGTTWYRDFSRLPLKPPQSFKPRILIKTGCFVFTWIWHEPVRGSQREENFQKTSLKAKKEFSAFRLPSLFIFQTCFMYSLTVLSFLPQKPKRDNPKIFCKSQNIFQIEIFFFKITVEKFDKSKKLLQILRKSVDPQITFSIIRKYFSKYFLIVPFRLPYLPHACFI